MKTGDFCEYSMWLTGTETPEQISHFKVFELEKVRLATEYDIELEVSPFEVVFKRPGEEHVPPVPPHVTGPDVRLMVATAKVGGPKPRQKIVHSTGFAEDLTAKDRQMLRKITREAHAKAHPGDHLSDRNCDQVIESLGPDVAIKTLRKAKAHGFN